MSQVFKNSSNSFKVILLGKKLSKFNEMQLKIWEHLLDKKRITRKEIEVILPNIPQQTIIYNIRKMKEAGIICSKGSSSKTYYEASF